MSENQLIAAFFVSLAVMAVLAWTTFPPKPLDPYE